jgi:eukaryotic-like serine/threonine-protein kinase
MSEFCATTAEHAELGRRRLPLQTTSQPLADEFELAGSVIDGRYLVEAPAGRGGFSLVYRARHLRLDSTVAIKVLRVPDELSSTRREAFIDGQLLEGKLLFELASLHPSIVRIMDLGVVATRVGVNGYLAMEWIEGRTLAADLARRRASGSPPHTLDETLSLLEPVAHALARAHARGVAHLDIKPHNMLVVNGSESTLKLLDFGLAKAVGSAVQRSEESSGKARRLTPAYAAPEQWEPRFGSTGSWTDVHTLALVCVELLSGKRVFQGDEAQLIAACLDERARPTPQRLGVSSSAAVEAVFSKALAVKVRDRFADAGAFWSALKSSSERASGRARPRHCFTHVGRWRPPPRWW